MVKISCTMVKCEVRILFTFVATHDAPHPNSSGLVKDSYHYCLLSQATSMSVHQPISNERWPGWTPAHSCCPPSPSRVYGRHHHSKSPINHSVRLVRHIPTTSIFNKLKLAGLQRLLPVAWMSEHGHSPVSIHSHPASQAHSLSTVYRATNP